jgi:MAM domain.
MEAGQRKGGQYPNAHYVSPMYYSGAYECKFNFWYNMYHFDRKILSDVKLNLIYRKNGRDTTIWTRQLSTGNKWMKATAVLPPCPKDFRVSSFSIYPLYLLIYLDVFLKTFLTCF